MIEDLCSEEAASARPRPVRVRDPGGRRHGIPADLQRSAVRPARTSKLFAHEWSGITPDIMMVAKLAAASPPSALLTAERAASSMTAGAARLWRQPLGCAVETPSRYHHRPAFLARSEPARPRSCAKSFEELTPLPSGCFTGIVRGSGLMPGVYEAANTIQRQAGYDAKRLTVPAADSVIRLLPPL
jgi:acetylornithine/N-succinyldiaminopimelate aminotransferase